VFALLLLAGLAGPACRKQEAPPAAGPPPAPVLVGQVVRKTAPRDVRAIGHVEAISAVLVRARIGGELTRVWFEEGDEVRQGQTLFSIDARQYEASLRQAEAQLARNEALLKKAEIDVTRYEGLVKQDYVTKEQYDQITTNVAALKAQIDADRATVDNARLQVAYCTISAPASGRTGSLSVKTGNLVRANDEQPLVTINQTHPIYVAFSVPAQVLPDVRRRAGAAPLGVVVTLPDSDTPPQEGTVTFVDNNVDTATSTILLKGTFANTGELLWPGQFVDVRLELGDEPDRVVAPAPAVQAGQQGQYVFVVKPDGTAEQRLVKIARADAKEAIIDSGLSGGETVVVDGHLRVVPGGKVVIREQGAGKS
jgi:multidrug efflux system membrane fusion protein